MIPMPRTESEFRVRCLTGLLLHVMPNEMGYVREKVNKKMPLRLDLTAVWKTAKLYDPTRSRAEANEWYERCIQQFYS